MWTWMLIAAVESALIFAVRVHSASPSVGDSESGAYNMLTSFGLALVIQGWIDLFKGRFKKHNKVRCQNLKFSSHAQAYMYIADNRYLNHMPFDIFDCRQCGGIHIHPVGRVISR